MRIVQRAFVDVERSPEMVTGQVVVRLLAMGGAQVCRAADHV